MFKSFVSIVGLVVALFVGYFEIYIAVADDGSDLKTYLFEQLSPYSNTRIYKQGPLVCAYHNDRCFCDRMPEGIQGLKVSSLIATRTMEIRPLTIDEQNACKAMLPSWRVASNYIWDTRPVKYIRSLPHPNDEAAFDSQGKPVRVVVGSECLYQTRLSKDNAGNTVYPTGKKQWRTVMVDGQLYQAYCESYQVDIWEKEQSAPSIITVLATTFNSKVRTDTHEWVHKNDYMVALPNTGANTRRTFIGVSPRMDYEVEFNRGGLYYVWVEGVGVNGGADSLHIGLNGKDIKTSSIMRGLPKTMGWTNDRWDADKGKAGRATMLITLLGKTTINVWMREDGAKVRKIRLALSSDYNPNEVQ